MIHSSPVSADNRELLRLLTCGSVDDGKSTLIGRLLYDANMLESDTLETVLKDSKTHGTTGGEFDPALVTDGLKAEREQGITIDVAYRYFATPKRAFIMADTPGHVQYTRNMVTGASTAQLAIILIDASNGLTEQTKRHSFIASLLGIKHIIIAINKMDIVDFSEEVYERIKADFNEFAPRLETVDLHFIPLSALKGDNVVNESKNMPWYKGPSLMHMLEAVHIASDRNLIDFRFPVQYVSRPDRTYRGYCGQVVSGIVRKGEEVMVLPSRTRTRVKSIDMFHGEAREAFTPNSVTLRLEHEVDVSRGDMIVHPKNAPKVLENAQAMLVWMSEDPLKLGKEYIIKHTSREVAGNIDSLQYEIDMKTLSRKNPETLKLNGIGRVSLDLHQPIMCDSYRSNRATGAFIVIDRVTHATVGAGIILDRSSGQTDDVWTSKSKTKTKSVADTAVQEKERSKRYGHKPATIILTGLSAAGKAEIAYALEERLFDMHCAVSVLDSSKLRQNISRDLSFRPEDRSEHIRRMTEMAALMNDAGLISICSVIAPDTKTRNKAKKRIGEERFVLVHVETPIEECKKRDSNHLYKKAEKGDIQDFPGVNAKYTAPKNPDASVRIDTMSVGECVECIVEALRKRKIIT